MNTNSTTVTRKFQGQTKTKPATVEIPTDPAGMVLAAIAELDLDLDTIFERGVLYGLIAIATERRGLTVAIEDMTTELAAMRTAVEDIAAVMVANDPKSQENQQ